MSERWEISRVSTEDQVLNKIGERMLRPVCSVVFGADCDFKNEIVEKLTSGLPGLVISTNAPPTPTLVKYIQEHDTVAVVLNSEESAAHGLRHELVKLMRNAGAKTVVGIYVKPEKPGEWDFLAPEIVDLAMQIDAIEQSNPTADGLDYFIVIEEE